ncbi:40S ribosomal protein S2 [Plecturocebus cupreus]
MPVQKWTRTSQCTRFKVFVAIQDYNGHVGLGVKCFKEVATAIRRAIILATFSIVPMCRSYCGNKAGKPHTIHHPLQGDRLPWFCAGESLPRGTGIVLASMARKMQMMASIGDYYTSARGCTAIQGNSPRSPLMPSLRPTAT